MGGNADEDHTQIVGGYTAKSLGGDISPLVSAPLSSTPPLSRVRLSQMLSVFRLSPISAFI